MRRLLIANRGEIACRIIRSARKLGISPVAVYSEADRGALHVEMADDAVEIGPPQAALSYLDASRIISAANGMGADAVHPGYGFLAESADFADAVLEAGLTWVGPSPETIRRMGDKQSARETARSAGVPVLPGSARIRPGEVGALKKSAEDVGLPLLVKASAGGGGIGMRRVDAIDALEETVSSVQQGAEKAFGSGDVYLERLVPRARHVEVQVFGFGDGTAMHLFERDCSLQRRFQKIIEEAPAPRLAEGTRRALHEASLALCRQTKYSGAGTVEFVLDAETGEYFFLEMNTRIQVEHPVSEMVTGVDLVAMQLELAGGARPDAEVGGKPAGHAIECRLYAENPRKMFFPSPGRLERFVLPEEASDLRVETGYREGDVVSPFYDPMIAKIIAHGTDRRAAVARSLQALNETEVTGITCNRDFLVSCLRHDSFVSGDVHTGFIEEHRSALIPAAG
ncbi:acetyl-CoA carboxylase biotin carboxylase subunit [Salibaculum sp.]|uniref:acetyl-CoA carboxylase biotin carboxylase subunit n=1 Tax=Salibaculum sp. TaxID=2855480 RepID=UPI002B490773|nr:biotin carboxylase N-terminal domain-containing protein [Salibaculum sp.]HKL70872.1 biotin carboxylase N-terminal domain-containing protein [Salibaculum sp.]